MTSLDRYLADREEHEKTEQRDITLESNPTVDDICRRYEGWLASEALFTSKDYDNGLKYIKGLEYTTLDVTEFSIRLKQYEDAEDFSRTGIFLSALINIYQEEVFEIITEHLETPIRYIGYKNNKQVTVNGDAGENVGFCMEGGSITVNGDAGKGVGCWLEGGSITVNGNAGNWVGDWMSKGSVRIEGEIEGIAVLLRGGKIYHKGKRVRPE